MTVNSAALSAATSGVLATTMLLFLHSVMSMCSVPTDMVATTFNWGPGDIWMNGVAVRCVIGCIVRYDCMM